MLFVALTASAQSKYGPNDTLLVPYIVYDGDTMTYAQLDMVTVFGEMTPEQRKAKQKWTRLRNAVYVTYPYAKKASFIINDVNRNLMSIKDPTARKKYLSSREKELKKEFTAPLTALSVYQGKVLMKLINRETGNNCYEIIKEYKGSVNARLYQTIAFFFNSNLKQAYDAQNDDQLVEKFVKEVQRMHGYQDISKPMVKITAM